MSNVITENQMSVEQFLNSLQYSTSDKSNTPPVGTFQELFKDFNGRMHYTKKLKDDGTLKNVSVMLTHKTQLDAKGQPLTVFIVCSNNLSPLVREHNLQLEHIMSLPVFRGDNGGTYVGVVAKPMEDVAKVKATAIDFEDTAA
tara:strand:+ start:74 stop:502 length:429 start_codon:yes stop_codon:yes gene_type:complete